MRVGKSDIKSKIFFIIIFLIAFLLSASIMPYVGFKVQNSEARINPDLLFALCIVCGALYDRKSISIIALVFGLVSDIFITPPVHLSPLLFFVSAYFILNTAGVFTKINALTISAASIPFFLIRSVTGTVYLMLQGSPAAMYKPSFGYILKNVVLPELACNVLAVFFCFLIVGFLYKHFKRRFFV